MPTPSISLLEPSEAAKALLPALRGKGTDFTIADAAARSGLPLRDAERGMHALLAEYRGHLRVTNDGDLLFRFVHGFDKPWEVRTRWQRWLRRLGGALLGAGRFVVRAWVMIVLVGYVAIFLAVLFALHTARSGESRSSDRGAGPGLAFLLIRGITEALFWTFHPFSPFAIGHAGAARGPRKRAKDDVGFYEKVNRFFFGPTDPPEDPRAMERRITAEIRAQKGRIGLADVMRVTGLPREETDAMMARLMLDYEGTVEVSEEGGISYRFAELRRTAEGASDPRPEPVWSKRLTQKPLTGNTGGANAIIVALNAFNLLMSLWAVSVGLTIEKVRMLLARVPLEEIPAGGTAIALGFVPLVFSLALFALPLVRVVTRQLEARKIERENGRRAVLREVLARTGDRRKEGVPDEALREAFTIAAGRAPSENELTREVLDLGGDVDLGAEDGVRYRFPDLELEAKAVEAEREAAAEDEAKLGPVVFTTET